ncbi:MAG: DUF4493 domain-containing protein [Bacteroidaceae bacterium]|nr:DUF4493 domain-containing protein [Bacteroidaceae bacterium]
MHTALRDTTLCLSLLLLLLLASCQQDFAPLPQAEEKGRIVLSFSDVEAYVDITTRSEHPLENLSDYVFTLSGTTAEGASVVEQTISITDDYAVFDAGTYTLHVQGNSTLATASTTGLGSPYYEGSSVDNSGNATTFTIVPGGLTTVKVLLKPANAQLTVRLATSFTDLYKTASLTAGSRTINLISLADDNTPATATDITAYLNIPESGSLNYTLSADARSSSHVTDIADVPGSINLTAATHTTLTLTADPVSGELIPIIEGEHSGEFD